ncbi:MAG TPA: glycosyltransferase 87 family protein [Anaerolineaceae bacterium]|nr:glycosyltransferase 87 family protein [Anaerolineaceae bacterium]
MNSYRSSILQVFAGVLVFAAIAAGLTWGNFRYAEQNPGGNDFLVHWVGTRAFFIHGQSPYSDEVALQIQTAAYGRPAKPGEHELRVAYPLYSTLIFAPFALIKDFTLARAVWMTTLEIALGLIAFLCLQLTHWKPGLGMLAAYVMFIFLFYHSVRAIINGNAVTLVTLFILLSFVCIREKRDELAGLFLGLATIKPQLVLLLIGFICLWAFSKKRYLLIGWIVGTVVLLSAAGMLFIPDWILQNLREVIRYPSYNPPGTPGAALAVWFPAVGRQMGWVLTFVLAVILLLEWLSAQGKEIRHFLWTASLTLVISQWIGIQTDPGNFIVLILPLVLIFSNWIERWKTAGTVVTLASMLILLVGIWALFLRTLQHGAQPVQSPIMFFPLPLFLLMGMYWVRWWSVQPPSLWGELIHESG